MIIVAGPGSGKTFTLIERVKYWCERGSDPKGFTMITFTRAGAAVMKDRLAEAGISVGFVGTLHSYCIAMLKALGRSHGIQNTWAMISEEDRNQLLLSIARENKCKDSLKKILKWKAARGLPGSDETGMSVALHSTIEEYNRRSKQEAFVDYDQILVLGLRLFSVLKKPLGDVLMVDEFQDTSAMDAAIYHQLERLFQSHIYVGDPDQSIFGFRGAVVGNILECWNDASFERFTLETNRRCCVAVCSLANDLISHNEIRIDKDTVPDKDSIDGVVGCDQYPDHMAELRVVVEGVRGSIEAGRSVAILCRYNVQVAQFRAAITGVGFKVVSLEPKIPVTDASWSHALTALSALSCPSSDRAIRSLLVATGWSEDDIQVAARDAVATFSSLNDVSLQLNTPDDRNLLWSEMSRLKVDSAVLSRIIEISDGLPKGWTIEELRAAIDEESKEPESEDPDDGVPEVTVATIHGAKGREWDVVRLPAFEQHLFPGAKEGEALEEERRLAFVAITRARKLVVITHCQSRPDNYVPGKVVNAVSSDFIGEMGVDC